MSKKTNVSLQIGVGKLGIDVEVDKDGGLRKSSSEPAPCVQTILSCHYHVAVVAVLATCDGLWLVARVRAIVSASDP